MNQNVLDLYHKIEEYDVQTAIHSKDVADHVRKFMLKMGYSKEDANIGYEAGLIHDAGKLLIPSELISKPGTLTEIERNIMEEHGENAAAVMRGIPQIYQIVAEHHHDDFGSENRNQIDALTPIVEICDVYSALTLDRSYKNRLTPMDAITVMTNEIAIFDKNTLNQFKDFLDEIGELHRPFPRDYEPHTPDEFTVASISYAARKYGLNPDFITVDEYKGKILLVYDKSKVICVLDNGLITEEPHEVELLSNEHLYEYDKEWTDKNGVPLEDIPDEEIREYEDFLSGLDL